VKKYVLDTNLYVRAFRNESDAARLERFYASFAPVIYLSSVVAHEIMVGARSDRKRLEVEKAMARPFRRTKRVVTPSHSAWEESGKSLARLAEVEGLDLRRVAKSFVNDMLLAASCREAGMVLVTDNAADFQRISPYINLEFIEAWPI
jgi:predicted nucleic acid-binding protein